MSSTCPSDDTVLDLVEGRLDGGERERIDRHCAECDRCRALLIQLGRGAGGYSRTLSAGEAAGEAPRALPREGERVAGYRIVRPLGVGGMGAVFEAVHETIGRRVAIKVLRAEYAGRPELRERLFTEACAVNVVQHPGVVGISEFGHLPDGSA